MVMFLPLLWRFLLLSVLQSLMVCLSLCFSMLSFPLFLKNLCYSVSADKNLIRF